MERKNPVPSDLEIAQRATLKPITDIANGLGILDEELEPYGRYMAKVDLSILERLKDRPNGKIVTVTAITPTPLGEGKTVVAFGLGQALAKIGKKVCNTFKNLITLARRLREEVDSTKNAAD